jgi:2-methoxy-6-polyprenyl-1,4-benzoquinol methylase
MSAVSSTRTALGRVATRSRATPSLAPACSRCNSTSSKPNPYNPLNSSTPPPSSHPGTSGDGPTTHFGFKTVPQSLKESLVGHVFTSVSPKYDLMNDSMSLGIHRLWKDSFVNAMVPRLSPSVHSNVNQSIPGSISGWENWSPTLKCLDVAGGTGDIALKILDKAREKYGNRDVEVEIVDLNEGMLHEGQKRVAKTVYYNSESARIACRLIRIQMTTS